MQPEAIVPEPVPATTAPPLAARALSAVQREMSSALLVVLIVVCTVLSPHFLTRSNLLNLADQIPVFGILAVGQMLVILSGGIDLSVGSAIALSAFFAAAMSFYGVVPAIVVPLLVTGLFGFINGLGAAFTRVPPFILTLAMLSIERGLALQSASIYHHASVTGAGASPVSADKSSAFQYVSEGSVFGIPSGALIALAAFIVLAYVLRYTRFGRHVFAVGGNESAATLLGVRVRRVKLAIYTISGMMAGLAGVLYASRQLSAPPTAAQGYELDAITAVVVGGTLLTGGVGTVRGTVVGLLIISILPNIFNLLGIDPAWQQVARGAVLLAVVVLQLVILPGSRIGGLRLRPPRPATPSPA
ncbi:MAG TPA: ABC transporter permease [Chloroflexota bacterium]|nr:ABC transporter permease [Chloroflexota bacterium]